MQCSAVVYAAMLNLSYFQFLPNEYTVNIQTRVKWKNDAAEIRSEGPELGVRRRGSSKWQLTAALKMKEEVQRRGRGGTRDQHANGKIRNVIFWRGWGGLRGSGRAGDKEEAAREDGSACGEGCWDSLLTSDSSSRLPPGAPLLTFINISAYVF